MTAFTRLSSRGITGLRTRAGTFMPYLYSDAHCAAPDVPAWAAAFRVQQNPAEAKMAGKNTAVFGIYTTRAGAEEAVDALRKHGFRNTDISALFPDNAGTKDFAHEKNTKAPEGATTGATTGVVVGGVLGWLAGIGLLAIPGIGPLLAAGPIVAALAGAGAVGVAGGIVGALVGMGIPEYEAKRFEGRIKHGGILLSVHCDDEHWVKRAEEIMKQTGGEDIASAGEAHADFAVSDKPLPRTRGTISDDAAATDSGGVTVTDAPVNADVIDTPRIRTTGGGTTYEP